MPLGPLQTVEMRRAMMELEADGFEATRDALEEALGSENVQVRAETEQNVLVPNLHAISGEEDITRH